MNNNTEKPKTAIVIHGGAGTIPRSKMSPEKEADIRLTLEASVRSGYELLLNGADSTD